MRVLITGAGGFLGRGLRIPFEKPAYQLRLMDIVPFQAPGHEVVVGDVARLEDCQKAMKGMDALVVAHMAPRNPDAYVNPVLPFDINVKGTANLFFAAVENKVKRAVLISSASATMGFGAEAWGSDHLHTLPPKSVGMYGLTKALQEIIAEQYSREFSISVSALRLGYITDEDKLEDKYGKKLREFSHMMVDRRDIGEVARLCLERPDIKYEVFKVSSTDESMTMSDVQHTCDFLKWKPQHPFRMLPKPKGMYGN